MADIAPDPVIANTTAHKLNIAKQKKESGDQAFKIGNAKDGMSIALSHAWG